MALAPFAPDLPPADKPWLANYADQIAHLSPERFFSDPLPTPTSVVVLLWNETLPAYKPLFAEMHDRVLAAVGFRPAGAAPLFLEQYLDDPAEVARLVAPLRMAFLFLQSVVPTIPASFLTFGSHPLYRRYESLPKLWGLTALNDQLIAGLIMKLGAGLMLWGLIAVIFFRWAAAEERRNRPGPGLHDLDRELTEMGLRA